MQIAIQMDPLDKLHQESDSSLILANEAQKRGNKIFIYQTDQLSLINDQVFALLNPLKLIKKKNKYQFKLGPSKNINLSKMDIVLMRQDPPFNLNYITATYILEHLYPKTIVINNPESVRNAPEKIYVTFFKHLMPPTLISENVNQIKKFVKQYKEVIIKPLYEKGGKGIFKINLKDRNITKKINTALKKEKLPVISQKYLSEIKEGDKRIVLFDGNPVGAMARIPTKKEIRANLSQGGIAQKCSINQRDKYICKQIKPWLKKNGLFFAGIDIIGKYLTEINVTSPTGIVEINQLENTNLEKEFWNLIEKKIKRRHGIKLFS